MNHDLSFKLLSLVILAGLIMAFVNPRPAPAAVGDSGGSSPVSVRVAALPLP